MQIGIDSFAASITDPVTGVTLSHAERMHNLLAEIELVLQANWQLLDGCGCALSTNG